MRRLLAALLLPLRFVAIRSGARRTLTGHTKHGPKSVQNLSQKLVQQRIRRLGTWLVGSVSGFIILGWTLTPPPSSWVDTVYTGNLYAALARVLVPLTDVLPTSFVSILGVGGFAWLGVVLVRSYQQLQAGAFLRHWALRTVLLAGTLYALFIVMWGANYGRTPLETRYMFSPEPTQSAEVESLARELALVIRQDAPDNPGESILSESTWSHGLAAGRTSLTRLVGTLEQRCVTLPTNVKRTPPGLLIFTGQATGIVSPWTLEAHVDGALPLPYALATALHEMTHLAGYGSEAETDFIAGLAGLTSGDPYLRYSTALTLFSRVSRALPRGSYRALYAELPEVATRDMAALRDVYARYLPPPVAAWLQTAFYDGYLRSQGVGSGVADYDRATDLLVAARRAGLLEFFRGAFQVTGLRAG